ncbi:ATP-binding cassette domain-containing protein, partial [Candidatus Wolfebacteria bacterium]|nr:ATP-binding cassette domain-containing protein [Candidatus Wolfebacteria bacterium]
MIKVQNLVKIYKSGEDSLTVLKGLNFEIKKGEFISVIGRSGSGKSTLLYQLGLLDYPTSGVVYLDGQDTSL